MAVCTLHNGETITGTFNSIQPGGAGGPGNVSGSHVVLTGVTDVSGVTLANKQGGHGKNSQDTQTATTVRIALDQIRTLI